MTQPILLPATEYNLDAMTVEQLHVFALACRGPVVMSNGQPTGRATGAMSRTSARALFPGRPKGYISATETLCAYAWNKATAQRLRLEGAIDRARIYEDICDRLYTQLPDWARGW